VKRLFHGKGLSTPKAKSVHGTHLRSRYTVSYTNFASRGVNGATRQAEALRREGVVIETNAMGEYSIDLSEYGWFPDMLPSEEDDEEEEMA
jgi:hypothetical protein